MQPLNRAERNSAFLGFLLLFLITIAVIVAALVFSIQVPCRESEQLRGKIFIMQKEKELSDSFNVAMKKAMVELNTFDIKKEPKEPVGVIKQRVQYQIDEMNKWIKHIPSGNTSIYPLVVQNVAELNDAKAKIRNLEDEKN